MIKEVHKVIEIEDQEDFETKKEREDKLNRERVKRFRHKNKVKAFVAEFKENDGLDVILSRLKEDKVTKKEFILKAFRLYTELGGFPEYYYEEDKAMQRLDKELQMIKKNPKTTALKMADKLEVHHITIMRDLAKLREDKKIKFNRKTSEWVLLDKGE